MRLSEMENPLFLNRKAHVAIAEGNLNAALDLFKKAHQGDPRNVSYLNSIVSIMQKLDMFKESIEYLDKLIVLQPKNIEFRLRKIDSLIKSGLLNEALDAYNEAIDIDPNDPELYWKKADFLRDHENLDGAILACS